MEAKIIYDRLNADFINEESRDDWSFMRFNEFITDEFKQRHMGLMIDGTKVITKVFIVTFPDTALLNNIIENNTDVLIFSHHAMNWDTTQGDFPFYDIPYEMMQRMKERRISFYVLHAPLDKNGEYSTAIGFMGALRFKQYGEFCCYNGSRVGLLCKTEYTSMQSLSRFVEERVGHPVKLWAYGDDGIAEGKIAIAAGGGGYPFVIEELHELGINAYITGVTRKVESYQPSIDFHTKAAEYKINVIAATHYSTEKWACMNMLDYFRRIGLGSVFLPGRYDLGDY